MEEGATEGRDYSMIATPEIQEVAKQVGVSVGAMNSAESLYRWMADDLKDHEGRSFLPANVCCDYAGMRGFVNEMARRIDASL